MKDQLADCEVITDVNCQYETNSWYKYNQHRRRRDNNITVGEAIDDKRARHGNTELCVNVRCIRVMRAMVKFGAKPKAFPYDVQNPYLEFKSRAYPESQLTECLKSL